MPHISIKHFPAELTNEKKHELMNRITQAIRKTFDCNESVISISLEAIQPEVWQEKVYQPEIKDKWHMLCKIPNY